MATLPQGEEIEEGEEEMVIDLSLLPGGVLLDCSVPPPENNIDFNADVESGSLPKSRQLLLDFFKPVSTNVCFTLLR